MIQLLLLIKLTFDPVTDSFFLSQYDWSLVIRNGTFHDARNGHSYFCEWMRSDRCDSCPRNAHDKCWHNGICQRIEPFYRELNSELNLRS